MVLPGHSLSRDWVRIEHGLEPRFEFGDGAAEVADCRSPLSVPVERGPNPHPEARCQPDHGVLLTMPLPVLICGGTTPRLRQLLVFSSTCRTPTRTAVSPEPIDMEGAYRFVGLAFTAVALARSGSTFCRQSGDSFVCSLRCHQLMIASWLRQLTPPPPMTSVMALDIKPEIGNATPRHRQPAY